METVHNAWKVFKKECREHRTPSLLLATLLAAILILAIVVFLASSLRHMPSMTPMILGLLVTFIPLGMNCIVFSILSPTLFLKERLSRTLESLLATPLGFRDIWLGKALFVTAVGVGAAWATGVLSLGILNTFAGTGRLLFPRSPEAVFFLTAMPLVALAINGLLGLLLLLGWNQGAVNFMMNMLAFCLFGGPGFISHAFSMGWKSVFVVAAAAFALIIAELYGVAHVMIEMVVIGPTSASQMRRNTPRPITTMTSDRSDASELSKPGISKE